MSRHHLPLLRNRRWQHVRRAVFDRDGWRCTACRRSGALEAHHEPPLRDGADPYDMAGIVTLCRGCHVQRHRGRVRAPTAAESRWSKLVAEIRHADYD